MDEIKHKGFVSRVSPGSLYVTIVNQAACTECHAKAACTISDFKEKEIEITTFRKEYKTGENVTVILRESSGMKAILFAYIIPFVVLLFTLIVLVNLIGNEILSGFIALGMLLLYYCGLWLFREKLKKSFRFELEE
jgi:positive regulator of sigma E activity